MKKLRTSGFALASVALAAGVAGCGAILGLDDFTEGPGSGGAGGSGATTSGSTGGAGGATAASSTSSTSSTTTTTSAGTGGAGGGGTGGAACMPVAETCANPVDEDCDGYDCVRWANLFGSGGDQTVGGVAVDAQGNVIVAGVFSGTLALDANNMLTATGDDVYLAKFDPTGKVVWSKSFSAVTKAKVNSVAIDSTSKIAIAGTVDVSINFGAGAQSLNFAGQGDFLAEFKPDGSLMWSSLSERGDSSSVGGLAFDAAGNVVVAGDSYDNTVPSVALWIEKRTPAGAVTWSKLFDTVGNTNDLTVGGLAFDPLDANRILLGGAFKGGLDFGGATLSSINGYDAFLLEADSSGAIKVREQYGAAGDQRITGVAFDADGNRVVVGRFTGALNFGGTPASLLTSGVKDDIFVAKLNLINSQIWAKSFGNDADQIASGLAVDSSGNVFFSGRSVGDVDFGGGVIPAPADFNVPLVKLGAADGATLWSKVFGDAQDQAGVAIAAIPGGGVAFGGNVAGSIDVGTGSKTSAGGLDILVARFAP